MINKNKTCTLFLLTLLFILSLNPIYTSHNTDSFESMSFEEYVIASPDTIKTKYPNESHQISCNYHTGPIVPASKQSSFNTMDGPINSSWPMFCHDNHHSGLSPYPTASNPGIEKWRYKTEGSVDGGIAIDIDGTLYFGDFGGRLYALYPNGTLKWKKDAMGLITTSTPCITEDGYIYIAGHSKLQKWDRNGTCIWSVGIGGNSASAPAVSDDGTIYIGSSSYDMLAFYPNGTRKWSFPTGYYVTSDAAIADDGTIIFGSGDTWIYALYPNGTLRWKYKTGHVVKGSASIDDNGIIYMASGDDHLYAFYPNGTLKWKSNLGYGSETNPSFGPEGTVYYSYDGLWAVDPVDGSVKWKFDYLEEYEKAYLSSPAISTDGIIYIGTEIDGIYGGHIYAFNSDGTLRWKKLVANINIASSPAIAEDGTVYIGSQWNSEGEGGYGCVSAFNEFVGQNHPPETPTINAPENLWFIDPYCVIDVKTTDPDLHPCRFVVDWGDFTLKEQSIKIASTAWETFYHTYLPIPLTRHTIRVKAIDNFGAESDWATLTIRLPHPYIFPGWQHLIERFPLFEWFFNLIK